MTTEKERTMTENKEKTELLPCPFCGGTHLTFKEVHAEDDNNRVFAYQVFCENCYAGGRYLHPHCWCETHQMAIEAWNDRFTPAIVPSDDPKRVQISLDALRIIDYELTQIINDIHKVKYQLTPVKMVK